MLLDAAAAIAERVALHFLWRPQANDPDDDMVLETAVNASADGIATFNLRDLALPAGRFGLAVALPSAWLKGLSR